MERSEILAYVRKWLKKLAEESGVDMQKYMSNSAPPNRYFEYFCSLNADRQYMSSVVNYNAKHKDTEEFLPYSGYKIMESMTNSFDAAYVVEKYDSARSFSDAVIKKKKAENEKAGKDQPSPKNIARWMQYCTGIYDMAEYLTGSEKFSHLPSMERMMTLPENTDALRDILKDMRCYYGSRGGITGVGTAVCCNWLKECGAYWLAKPDIHMMRIIAAILCDDNVDYASLKLEESEALLKKYLKAHPSLRSVPSNKRAKLKESEYAVVYMYEWALTEKVTPFELDRLLFIYTGKDKFYEKEDRISIQKAKKLGISEAELINKIREK